MEWREMTETALEAGFTKAAVMKVSDLVFQGDLRHFCEENLCGNCGSNYSCPPDCGTPEEMEERARKYENALVFQTVYEVEDMSQSKELARLKKEHNKRSRTLIERLESSGIKGLSMLAGPCDLCSPCQCVKGQPCTYPHRKSSCLSAYCVRADKMAEACQMVYWGNGHQVAYFSLYLF